jgi:hypothetical protein
MISRIWRGWTTPENADTYEALLKVFTGIIDRRISGFRGIDLLRREQDGAVEFVTIMWFDSLLAVRTFAGEDYERAVVLPQARRLLLRFDERSAHYEVREQRGPTLLALLFACGRSSSGGSRKDAGDSLARTAQADTARWIVQKARQDSATVVTHARLTPLTVLPQVHAVCRLSSRDEVPRWATIRTDGVSSVTRTGEELSIIVTDSLPPRNVRCERNWRVIKVRGPLQFDLVGIISGISGTLAAAGISIFAFSTFDTDYVMVKEETLGGALNALRRAEYPIVDFVPRSPGATILAAPVDEAVTDPDFFLFRARLQTALANHDTAEVMRAVDPGILNSFGGDGGRDEFRERWRLNTPDKSQLWGALGFVLALGGRFLQDSAFYAPYLFHNPAGADGFETLIVLGSNVPVHAGPGRSYGVIDTVSFEAVTKWREKSTTSGWEPIKTSDGKPGWVVQRHLRSPIDYRAGFVRRDGRWWLRALVAGD